MDQVLIRYGPDRDQDRLGTMLGLGRTYRSHVGPRSGCTDQVRTTKGPDRDQVDTK